MSAAIAEFDRLGDLVLEHLAKSRNRSELKRDALTTLRELGMEGLPAPASPSQAVNLLESFGGRKRSPAAALVPRTFHGVRAFMRGRTALVESTADNAPPQSPSEHAGDGSAFSKAARESLESIIANANIDDSEKVRQINQLLGAKGTALRESIGSFATRDIIRGRRR
jgi:hypothetical protein